MSELIGTVSSLPKNGKVLTRNVKSIMLSWALKNFLPVTIPALLTRIVTLPTACLTYRERERERERELSW